MVKKAGTRRISGSSRRRVRRRVAVAMRKYTEQEKIRKEPLRRNNYYDLQSSASDWILLRKYLGGKEPHTALNRSFPLHATKDELGTTSTSLAADSDSTEWYQRLEVKETVSEYCQGRLVQLGSKTENASIMRRYHDGGIPYWNPNPDNIQQWISESGLTGVLVSIATMSQYVPEQRIDAIRPYLDRVDLIFDVDCKEAIPLATLKLTAKLLVEALAEIGLGKHVFLTNSRRSTNNFHAIVPGKAIPKAEGLSHDEFVRAIGMYAIQRVHEIAREKHPDVSDLLTPTREKDASVTISVFSDLTRPFPAPLSLYWKPVYERGTFICPFPPIQIDNYDPSWASTDSPNFAFKDCWKIPSEAQLIPTALIRILGLSHQKDRYRSTTPTTHGWETPLGIDRQRIHDAIQRKRFNQVFCSALTKAFTYPFSAGHRRPILSLLLAELKGLGFEDEEIKTVLRNRNKALDEPHDTITCEQFIETELGRYGTHFGPPSCDLIQQGGGALFDGMQILSGECETCSFRESVSHPIWATMQMLKPPLPKPLTLDALEKPSNLPLNVAGGFTNDFIYETIHLLDDHGHHRWIMVFYDGSKAELVDLTEENERRDREGQITRTGRRPKESIQIGEGIYRLQNFPTVVPETLWSSSAVKRFVENPSLSPNPEEVYHSVEDQLRYFSDLDDGSDLVDARYACKACQVIATYFYDTFSMFPYGLSLGTYQSGKSTDIKAALYQSYHGYGLISNPTPATIFRLMQTIKPTLGLDNVERLYDAKVQLGEESVSIVEMLDVGAYQGGKVTRVEGSAETGRYVAEWEVYGPKFLNSTKGVAPSLKSRSITTYMIETRNPDFANRQSELWPNPRTPNDAKAEQFGKNRDDLYTLRMLRLREVQQLANELNGRDFNLAGRSWDIWRPIFTIAKIFCPDKIEALKKLAVSTAEIEKSQRIDEERTTLLQCLVEGYDGRLWYPLSGITASYRQKSELEKTSSRTVSNLLKILGFIQRRHSRSGSEVKVNKHTLRHQAQVVGIDVSKLETLEQGDNSDESIVTQAWAQEDSSETHPNAKDEFSPSSVTSSHEGGKGT